MVQIIFLIMLFAAGWWAISWINSQSELTREQNRRNNLEIDVEVEELKSKNDDLASTLNSTQDDE